MIQILSVRDPAQAWRIAVLTFIVLVVGCNRSHNPPQPSAPAKAERDTAQQDVKAAQGELDELGAALSKSEVVLGQLKSKLAEQSATADPPAEMLAALNKEISALEAQVADQRAQVEQATKKLTDRNLVLQKSLHDENKSVRDSDNK